MTRAIVIVATVAMCIMHRTDAHADVVRDWNAIMESTVRTQNPIVQGRFAAITQLAVFEAVNAITGEFTPYLGTISAPPDASPEAAAVAAASGVLTNYVPASAADLAAARAASLALIPDGPSKEAGIAVGESSAAAMIALRATDGSAPPQFFTPTSTDPGQWQPTATCPPAGGVFYHWQHVTPFGLESGSQFRASPPPSLTSPRYARDYDEVRRLGDVASVERPIDGAEVAVFYNTLLAVGVWNQVARQLAAASDASMTAGARAFALLNMAINDGLIASFDTKYHYTLWRPETAIHGGGSDGNARTEPQADYAPLVPTPCFPSYPSAHASASYAAKAVLLAIWGNGGHAIELTHPALPNTVRSYTTLKQITDDIDDARVYGGIHFRFDQVAGGRQGKRTGKFIYTHYLQPVG
jgi:hypothetical protein